MKELFPNILFTIGDNGTVFLLQQETFKALTNAGLHQSSAKIAVLGPYGLLGEMMVKFLLEKGYNVMGVGTNKIGLETVSKKYGIPTPRWIG